ncbi:MAG TPA: glycosyltransferase [Thermoanaerobaculia bacterium]|nr:glycosyltransferase [Thermoanaerobaculia bacterium]
MNGDPQGRLFVLDPAFTGVAGHHYPWNQAIVAECRRRGIAVRIGAHRSFRGDAASLPVEGVFTHSIYPKRYFGRMAPLRRQFLEDLGRLSGWGLTSADLFLLHSVSIPFFIAFSDWFASLPRAGRPRCVVLHTVAWFEAEWPKDGIVWRQQFRRAAARLANAAGTGLTFGAINEPLCRDWEAFSGQPARVHPIPYPAAADFPPGGERSGSSYRLLFPGGARDEKGLELLPDLVRLLARKFPLAECVIQVAPDPRASRETLAALRRLEEEKALRAHWGDATAAEYQGFFATADVVMLPYDPVCYRVRGSSVLAEALICGLPAILPAGTWMAEEWKRLEAGGALFQEWTAEAVSQAAVEALRAYGVHRARSLEAAARWTARHSAAAFMDFVLGPAIEPAL